ncbi:putative pre-16S rRNA nuclease YqgF [Candidatus Phytoplasma solani]
MGYPKHMNNVVGIKAKISIEFKKLLENKFPQIEIILWDERLTTVQSLKILRQNNKTKVQIKEMKDAIAATIILQNYLDFKEIGNV